VQDHVGILGDHAPDLDSLTGVLLGHTGEVFNEALLAIGYAGVVLDVSVTYIAVNGLCRAALVEHQLIERCYRLFVAFEGAHRSYRQEKRSDKIANAFLALKLAKAKLTILRVPASRREPVDCMAFGLFSGTS
jgi:hypothetical protein